jgi:TRAP transporter TAXI family solute receptor
VKLLWFAVVTCALIASGCAAPQRAPRPRPVVRLMSGPTGGGFYPLGEGLATAFSRLLPDITVEHHPSTGAVSNAELIQAGNADVGFVFADVAYVAYVGRLERKQVFDRLRGVAVLELTPLHLVVRPGIASVRDLRGRRVAVGPPGSGTALTAEIVLRAFDIKLSDIHTEALQFDDAARRLIAGHLDAMFDTAIYPAEAVRMAAAAGARLMPLTGSPIDKLRHEYPFFRAAVIPRDAYPGVTGAVHTIGVDSLLVCRRDMDEELVYQLTRRFFEALPMLSSSRNALRLMDLDQAPATPIPLHDGAARYYRERELLR